MPPFTHVGVSGFVYPSPHQRATERACMSIKDERKRASKRANKRASQRANTQPLRAENHEPQAIPKALIVDPRIQKVLDFMHANLHQRVRLPELAAAVNLSTFRFSHVFKSQTGISPGEYLRRLRMEKARNLLGTTLLTVKETMVMAGYNSKSLFVRHFRRSFGVAPSEYRKGSST